MGHFDHRRKRADAEAIATTGNEGMNVHDGAAPVELIEYRLVFANPSYSPHSRDSLTGMVQTSEIA
jgi:hypothetical protein